jgi:hypothetical protein
VSNATDQKVLVSKPFTLLVILVLLEREGVVRSFLFVLHHRETLSTVLLNSLKEQSV